ncbi:MAG: metal ABC transporter substrate-binding protein [Candidatus Zixiibacteriota bacterium]
MKTIFRFALLMAIALAGSAQSKVSIVASSTDLASIATYVGGDLIEVQSIGQGKSNLHFVEVLPSYMMKVARADIYLKVGLALDAWAQGVIDGARNDKLLVVDCSTGIEVLGKPTGKVDASMGDLHPDGNPHYWLDPRNGKVIANNICNALITVDPVHKADYQSRLAAFETLLDSKWNEWQEKTAAFRGAEVITYHSSFAYLANAFGFSVAGFIEPKPGIEPTAEHNNELIQLIKGKHISMILRDPYYSARAPESIARESGAVVYVAPSSVGGTPSAKDYISLFDSLVDILVRGAK